VPVIGAMQLATWLSKNKMTNTEFARKVGVVPSYVTAILSRKIWPSREVMKRIVAATDGRVTPNDLL
jgi:transcriptional regulator with XRE-family HTH domain